MHVFGLVAREMAKTIGELGWCNSAVRRTTGEYSSLIADDDVSKRQDRAVHDLLDAMQRGTTAGGGGVSVLSVEAHVLWNMSSRGLYKKRLYSCTMMRLWLDYPSRAVNDRLSFVCNVPSAAHYCTTTVLPSTVLCGTGNDATKSRPEHRRRGL